MRRAAAGMLAWALLACAGAPPPAAPAPAAAPAEDAEPEAPPTPLPESEHRVWGEPWRAGPGTDTAMTERIRAAAREMRGGPVPRLAFVELRFPGSEAEYEALRGHGVMRLTAISRDPGELPPARVFARGEEGETEFTRYRLYQSEVPASETEIIEVIGRARADALYVFPLERITRPGQLLIDFAKNRVDFALGGLPLEVPDLGYTLTPTDAGRPDPKALYKMAERNFPGLLTPDAAPTPAEPPIPTIQ